MVKPWKTRHGSRHHIIPRSKNGPDTPKNIYSWVQKKHVAYHQLFENYLPSKAIETIRLWTNQDGGLKTDLMKPNKLRAWHNAFNGGTPDQAIQFIRKNFLPVEAKFLRGELGGNCGKNK